MKNTKISLCPSHNSSHSKYIISTEGWRLTVAKSFAHRFHKELQRLQTNCWLIANHHDVTCSHPVIFEMQTLYFIWNEVPYLCHPTAEGGTN